MQLINIIMLAGLSAFATASAVPAVVEERALTYSCPLTCGPRPKSTVKTINIGALGLGVTISADILPPAPIQRLDGVCCSGTTSVADIAGINLSLQLLGLGGLNVTVASVQKNCVLQTPLNFGCTTGKAYCCNSYVSSNIIGFIGIDCIPSVLA